MLRYLFYISIILNLISSRTFAQGCSDAGFCSLGNIKNSAAEIDSTKNNALAFGVGYGQGLEDTQYLNQYLEYSYKMSTSYSLQAKLTTAYATGFAGNNFDAGDLFLFGTYRNANTITSRWSFLAGAKIPLNNLLKITRAT